MSGNSSEEKTLPPSARKITKEREKGHVAKAPELQSAIVSVALVIWLVACAPGIPHRFDVLVQACNQSLALPFPDALHLLGAVARDMLVSFGLVPLMIAVIAAILTGLIINQGVIFAIDPILPKLEKINPINGFKGLMKAKNFIELAVAVLKAILFGAILGGIAFAARNDLMRVPALNAATIPHILGALLLPMLGGACICYLVAGLVDILLQRALFMQEMRMTHTEAKNERKETLGNPQIKQQRMRLAMEFRRGVPVKLGLAQVTIMICGEETTIGLRYDPKDTPIPRIITKAKGPRATEHRLHAHANHIPTRWDGDLARDLERAFKPGMTINAKFFTPVAKAIQNT